MEKNLRLWKKSGTVLPFVNRSQKLAEDLMKTVGMKESIIDSFKEGKVLRTNCLNPLSIFQENLTEIDEGIISDLDKNGLLVYHVLISYLMVGKQIEIQCEHEVSTFEKVNITSSYLCVPKDIFVEAIAFEEDIYNRSNRVLTIQEYVEHELFMANQGCLYACVVSEDDLADFYNIGVNVLNGDLLGIS